MSVVSTLLGLLEALILLFLHFVNKSCLVFLGYAVKVNVICYKAKYHNCLRKCRLICKMSYILVGKGLSFFVCCFVYRDSTND